jgi:hypothetical protein
LPKIVHDPTRSIWRPEVKLAAVCKVVETTLIEVSVLLDLEDEPDFVVLIGRVTVPCQVLFVNQLATESSG